MEWEFFYLERFIGSAVIADLSHMTNGDTIASFDLEKAVGDVIDPN